jgi:hypothetical protein
MPRKKAEKLPRGVGKPVPVATPSKKPVRVDAAERVAEALQQKVYDLVALPEVEGAIVVLVTKDGKRVSCWAADTEAAAIVAVQGAGLHVGHVSEWLGKGAMRPGSPTH